MNVHEKLNIVQSSLKAPKGQYNNFGKYKYRSAEDILEAVKPLLKDVQATIITSMDVESVGDRVYFTCTATFTCAESKEFISVKDSAREPSAKKGMDDSQISGSTGSYAKKYALNDLLAIDDSKDADHNSYNNNNSSNQKSPAKNSFNRPSNSQAPKITPAHLNQLGKKVYGDDWESQIPSLCIEYDIESLSIVKTDQKLLEEIYNDLKTLLK